MARLSTHVLDTARGAPAAGIPVELHFLDGGARRLLATSVTNADGRVTITMPHPERSFRYVQNSWRPDGAGEYSGWFRMFGNARRWVG